MPALSLPHISVAFLTWTALVATAFCGSPITVTDDKGRSIEIELVSVADSSVTFRRQGNPKEFTLPISQFAGASQEIIRKQGSQIPAATPKIESDVVIGKRRQKNDSYYMVKQEITCTVKLTNTSMTARVPAVNGKLVFIGQNQRTPELLYILSSQNIEATMNPGETVTKELESFFTTYDSDNKGYGNVGGYQYFGYILVLVDEGGNVVLDQTATSSLRQALANKPAIRKEIIKYAKGKLLTERLDPASVAGNGPIAR